MKKTKNSIWNRFIQLFIMFNFHVLHSTAYAASTPEHLPVDLLDEDLAIIQKGDHQLTTSYELSEPSKTLLILGNIKFDDNLGIHVKNLIVIGDIIGGKNLSLSASGDILVLNRTSVDGNITVKAKREVYLRGRHFSLKVRERLQSLNVFSYIFSDPDF